MEDFQQEQGQQEQPDHRDTGDESKVALISGGSAGLGKAIAMELARRGWSIFIQHAPRTTGQASQGSASPSRVACGDLANVPPVAEGSQNVEGVPSPVETSLNDILAAAAGSGQTIQAAAGAANLAKAADRDRLVEQALEQFGRIDMLVNASFEPSATTNDLLEITEDAFAGAVGSASAAMFLTQLVANEMVRLAEAGEIEHPKIVTVNSIGAYTTSADHGPDCVARAAISMLTKLYADRLSEHGINVYEIRCGLISAGPDAVHARYDSLIAQGLTPIRRWGRPQDVARAVAAVAEDLLGFSTGEVINVDGGFHLRRL